MSGHRRVKDIDYDEDELEDFDEQDGDEGAISTPGPKSGI